MYIDIRTAIKDDIPFYLAKNGVILTRGPGANDVLPAKYTLEIATMVEPRKVVWKPGDGVWAKLPNK